MNVLLVPAHPGFPGQIPQSRKTVVCVVSCHYMQAIEKFAENVARIRTSLTRLCTQLQETEFPNDAFQTELLRADHMVMRQEFNEDLQSTLHHGEALRDCLAEETDEGDDTMVKHRTELRQDRLEHVDAIDR